MVNNALIEAYNQLDIQNLSNIALEIKKQYPIIERADFWWIDDMIDHIEFGKHSFTERERKIKEEDLIQRLRELLNTELNEDSVASIRIVTVDNNDIQVEMK